MLKKWYAILAALMLAFVLTACGETTDTEESTEPVDTEEAGEEENAESENEEAGDFPRTVTDALGEEIVIEEKPEKIVSLIPSITETLFKIEQGEYVVGRTDWDNYPEEVLDIESVGDMNFDVERVLSLSPDLVLSHESNAHSSTEGLDQIRSAGIPVVVINDASSIDAVYEAITMIGEASGGDQEAASTIEEMKERFAAIEEKASEISEEEQVDVWVEVSDELYTAGSETFIDEMLTLIRANNIADTEQGWPQFTEEEVVTLNPQVIITTYGYYVENADEKIKERAAWQDVDAVKNERIYDVQSDEVTRSGPRLVKGVEELASVIYPEVFGE
ncbi:ferric ion ABC transpoter (ferric ion-binding protein) [Alkalihalophilus pseudofirmus OF4]|jgi:iron complex transport system substrate-binding protein|uniref:Ferric ion ABC transpoter (Ferric ion-binding protein) n=1 Tax=Alkalihalophilus pseudofirmus (strain ATCC BAA-2126 / JCM 17055 / OF4) TaxID=398511 RepID=D3FZY2_ALKPO|nr:ABC transporter substrate-binding protein [Alkalihalophilus pseudofirmus]ADC51067.1 ferric ion ABC transpoter (ferric ion-binding protein) [Alkalihalophilus pseudofirmus OF4]